MKLLTRVREQSTAKTLPDRLVWQSASLLLAYPDERQAQRLDTVDQLLAHVGGHAAELLGRTVAALRASDPLRAAVDYVETFDLRRRTTMYLTYWTAGDTRNRGSEMHAFAAVVPRRRRRTAEQGSPPTTCRWCSSSPRPSTRRRAGGC